MFGVRVGDDSELFAGTIVAAKSLPKPHLLCIPDINQSSADFYSALGAG